MWRDAMAKISGQPPDQKSVSVPITEEVLSISTRTVDTGRGVRVHKTVHTEPVLIDEVLAQEAIDIQRIAIDRTLGDGEPLPSTRYEGDVLIIPVFEEVIVVERRMRLKEELHVTRIQHEKSHTQTVVLKSEQVSIERFDENDTP
jgi:stress response protein YsnF